MIKVVETITNPFFNKFKVNTPVQTNNLNHPIIQLHYVYMVDSV